MKNVVVAVSGGGRSLANLLKTQEEFGTFRVRGVVASRPDCGAVEIARDHGLPCFTGEFSGEVVAPDRLSAWLSSLNTHLIVLAGFLRIFPVRFPGNPAGYTTINIHPSLLPAHGGAGLYGLRVHRSVLGAGDRVTGASVHLVNERYDEGALISQIRVRVFRGDTPEMLASRVFAAECKLLPRTIHLLAQKILPDDKVWVSDDSELFCHDIINTTAEALYEHRTEKKMGAPDSPQL